MESVDEELLLSLKAAGCYAVSYGLESASNKVLRSMRKGLKIEHANEVLAKTKKAGLKIQANIILGDVEDDSVTVSESIDYFMMQSIEYDLNIAMIRVFPGTVLFRHAVERGIINSELHFLEQGCPLVNVSKLTDEQYYILRQRVFRLHNTKDTLTREVYYDKNFSFSLSKNGQFKFSWVCPNCFSHNATSSETIEGRHFSIWDAIRCAHCDQRVKFDLFTYNIEDITTRQLADIFFGSLGRINVFILSWQTVKMLINSQAFRENLNVIFESHPEKYLNGGYCDIAISHRLNAQILDCDTLYVGNYDVAVADLKRIGYKIIPSENIGILKHWKKRFITIINIDHKSDHVLVV
jgi:hypothetical protein